MWVYRLLAALIPTHAAPAQPRRIVVIRPCCIGDLVLTTPVLSALRQSYPDAHITLAVGSWSRLAVESHPAIDAILDTGPHAMPVRSVQGMRDFAQSLRQGSYDLAVSLVRSPLMSAALLLSGIPYRAGLHSAGRGFGYNIRAVIDPTQARHEAQVFLDVTRALGINIPDESAPPANLPVHEADHESVRVLLSQRGINGPYIVVNPAGGSNPGMTLSAKRYPPTQMAALIQRIQARSHAPLILLAGPKDGPIIDAVQDALSQRVAAFVGLLSFGQIAALAANARLYLGNDTGLTHLAAATGAPTAMIFGPSDPARYAPFTPKSLALWKPAEVANTGVSGGAPSDWDWQRDGITVDAAYTQISAFLDAQTR